MAPRQRAAAGVSAAGGDSALVPSSYVSKERSMGRSVLGPDGSVLGPGQAVLWDVVMVPVVTVMSAVVHAVGLCCPWQTPALLLPQVQP